VQSQRQPPAVRSKRLRIYYATQVEAGPPRFRVYVNDRRLVVRDYGYFVENRLRARYRLEGVPAIRDWLAVNVHAFGRRLDTEPLVERATGRGMEAAPFLRHARSLLGAV